MASRANLVDYPGSADDAIRRRLVCPSGYRSPVPRKSYHLVVIGAGPAGLVTAMAAAHLGAKVALVERSALGGDCLNAGCIPSKALLEFTRRRDGGEDFDAAFAWLRRVRADAARQDAVERYVEAGVDVFLGSAKFLTDDAVGVGAYRLATRRAVIATGSHPSLPAIPGLADSRPHTTETLFDMQHRPRRLGIIGAGPVGCETAQAFARLGVDVVLLESANAVLPAAHPEARTAVGRALREAGVRLELRAEIDRVARRGAAFVLALGERDVVVDELLVATGRRPNTDELNLAAVGVETDADARIIVDRHLKTTNPRIYAAGDVCSGLQYTHKADADARVVVQNALFAPTATSRIESIPRCTYTDPEVAEVGQDAETLRRGGVPFDVYRARFDELDRGRAQHDVDGFAEILTAAGSGRILGATIVGHDAAEQIAPICIAMANDLGLGDLGKAVLPYPTRAEYLRRLSDAYGRTRLTPFVQRALRAWLRWTG